MEFDSFAAFAVHLQSLAPKVTQAQHEALKRIGERIEKTAKDEMGTYQPAVGPFEAWKELSPVTKEDRVKNGYTENDPLLRSGELRGSIGHTVDGHQVAIGSTSPAMVTQELGGYLVDNHGAPHLVPPRSVLGPAAIHNAKHIKEELGQATVDGLLPPGRVVPHGPTASDFNFEV